MICTECGKRSMLNAHRQYHDDTDDKTYFPYATLWVRTSQRTWKEMQLHICLNCGCVRAVPTGNIFSEGSA